MNKIVILFLFLVPAVLRAQSFEPCADSPGSHAIHKDSSAILAWATSVELTRGFMDFQDPGLGLATYGSESDALGPADGTTVVSLGDRGVAVLQFDLPITNGPGPDFAVFENGFTDGYMEFAFVEVSSDGLNFFRFPATSEIPIDVQSNNFTITDCGSVNNLAGKYRANFGTPFDLEELNGMIGLDINQITHVKLIDVVGILDVNFGSMDSNGELINDPYPTAFPSSGFDLDAVAVLHQGSLGTEEQHFSALTIFPNPVENHLSIQYSGSFAYKLYSVEGQLVEKGEGKDQLTLDSSFWLKGIYLLVLEKEGKEEVLRVLK